MEPRANAASQSDSPATGAATFPAQHTTIGIGIRSSCCSYLATQTMVCSKMKDKIWQKARDKKHFIRVEIYWWQRKRTLMGHAHILWVLPPGGVLPMWWVIHMCRGFDPLFSLWQDRARSFWGIFFSSTNTKTIFWGIKTTNSYRIRSFRPQISFFPRSFGVQFSAASGTPPSFFGPSTPPGVLPSAARIAVRALNCITYHVAEPVGVWNGLCAPAWKPSNLLNSCVFILDAL